MDEQQNQQLMQLLKDAGLGDFSQYFTGDVNQITSLLGLQGEQANRFGQFFQPFKPQTALDLTRKAEESKDIRSGMLSERLTEQLKNLRGETETGLGQTRTKFGEMGAQSGLGSGFGAYQREQATSIKDILEGSMFKKGGHERAFERGGIASEEQYGRERGAIFSELQRWLNQTLGRGERMYALDPHGGGTWNSALMGRQGESLGYPSTTTMKGTPPPIGKDYWA